MTLLAVFADALGYHYLEDREIREALGDIFEDVVPLETFLAYSSGLHPTIWTSVPPDRHGHWSTWSYNGRPLGERTSINPLRWKLRTLALKAVKDVSFRLGKGLDMDPAVPAEVAGYFKKEEYDYRNPYMEGTTIFSVLEGSWSYDFFSDLERFWEGPGGKGSDLEVCLLGDFDQAGHSHGPHSPEVKDAILALARVLRDKRNDYSEIMLFSDHGMSRVTGHVDVLKIARESGCRMGEDYMMFLDATMARFRFRDDGVQNNFRDALSALSGEVITQEKFGAYHIPEGYGDMIFLAEAGTEVYPNFFHPLYRDFFKGLHGYAPAHPGTRGLMAATFPLKGAGSILDIAPTIMDELGQNAPKTFQGVSLLG